MIVTGISMFGWLLANVAVANSALIIGDVIAICVVTMGIYILHKRIDKKIDELEEL